MPALISGTRAGVTGFNLYSLVISIIGAIVVLAIYHAIIGRRVYGGTTMALCPPGRTGARVAMRSDERAELHRG